MSLAVGGALTEVSWRLAFLVNVPIGLLVLYLASTALRETQKERMKLDATGAVLATLMCTAAVFGFSMAPEKGWLSAPTIGSVVVALGAFVAFAVVERTAENPIVPFDLFFDRNRLATFAAIFLAGGVLFTLTVVICLYVQDIMGYSGLRAGVAFIPFAIAVAVGSIASSRLVTRFPPRVVVIAGGIPVLGAMLYGSTLAPRHPVLPESGGAARHRRYRYRHGHHPALAIGDRQRRCRPHRAHIRDRDDAADLGGPVVLGVIQAAITSRTLSLGGTTGPVKYMNPAQLHALDQAYTYGLLWLAGVAVLIGVVALFIGYTAQQVAHAQEVKKAMDAEEP